MRSRRRRTPPRALQRSTGAYCRDKRASVADKYIMKSPDVTALKWEMRVPLLPFVYSGRNRWRPRRQLQTLKDPPDRLSRMSVTWASAYRKQYSGLADHHAFPSRIHDCFGYL
jgi:hypothetical protein